MRSPAFFGFGLFAPRAPVKIPIALAIGAPATEGRTLLEDPALILVFTARPIAEAAFVARMLVPVGAAFGALARTVELRTVATARTAFAVIVTAGPVEFWTILARAIKLGPIEFGALAERTITRRTIVARTREARTVIAAAAFAAIVALLPGLVLTAVAAAEVPARALAEILARRPVAARSRIALLPGF